MSELLKPGQLFAERYRIQRFLADGGMGAVFAAAHVTTERQVAVKVLWPHVLQSDSARRQFELEAKLAARIGSEHVVSVLDAGVDSSTRIPFLVMELLEGATLHDVAQQRGAVPPSEVCGWLTQAARGLDKAHQHVDARGQRSPIVHRDLKPENLFLTQRETGEPLLKILDFGIAKVLSQTAMASAEIKGTPLFMAPEQALGITPCPQTDVWALGLIAFYLTTGRHYWKSADSPDGTISALLLEITHHALPVASLRARELGCTERWPSALDPWLERCLRREPAERFASAGEAAHALARVLAAWSHPEAFEETRASEVPRASPDSAPVPTDASGPQPPGVGMADTRPGSSRGRVSAWAALLLLLVALGAGGLTWWASSPQVAPAPASPPVHEPDPLPAAATSPPGDLSKPEPADVDLTNESNGVAAEPAKPSLAPSPVEVAPEESESRLRRERRQHDRQRPPRGGRAPEQGARREKARKPREATPSTPQAAPPTPPEPPRDPYEGR